MPASVAIVSASVNCALLTPALRVDERLGRDRRGLAEMFERFVAGVGLLSFVDASCLPRIRR